MCYAVLWVSLLEVSTGTFVLSICSDSKHLLLKKQAITRVKNIFDTTKSYTRLDNDLRYWLILLLSRSMICPLACLYVIS